MPNEEHDEVESTGKGSGLGKKLWGLLVKTEDADSATADDDVPASAAKPAAKPAARIPARPAPRPVRTTVTAPPNHPAASSAPPPKMDPDIRSQLEEAMLSDNDNSVGQLIAMMDSLAEDISDPAKLLRAAIKALKGQGVTTEKIVADLASDENILSSKETEFQGFIAEERKNRLGAKQQEAAAVGETVAQRRQQIAAIEAEIETLTSRQGALETETAEEARQLADVESRFAVTLDAIRGERAELKSKIETNGKGA